MEDPLPTYIGHVDDMFCDAEICKDIFRLIFVRVSENTFQVVFLHNQIFFYCRIIHFRPFSCQKLEFYTRSKLFFSHMSVKVKGGGLRALADMSTKNVIIFYGRLPLTCPPPTQSLS